MLLPYLDKKIKEEEKFVVISEKDLTQQVKLVLSRLTLNNKDKENILNINWNHSEICNTGAIKKRINKNFVDCNRINIIVNGSKEYIQIVDGFVCEIFSKIKTDIKVINCYDITKLDDDIKEILKTHDIIINTSGEKQISEVFEGYESRGA